MKIIILPAITALICFIAAWICLHCQRLKFERRERILKDLTHSLGVALELYIANDRETDDRVGKTSAIDKVVESILWSNNCYETLPPYIRSLFASINNRLERLYGKRPA